MECEIGDVKEFAMYQLCRTKAMFEHSMNMFDTYENEFDTKDRAVLEEYGENTIRFAPANSLAVVKDTISVINDLAVCILNNKTETSFITSDTPVIVINPIGIHCAGLDNIGTVIQENLRNYASGCRCGA